MTGDLLVDAAKHIDALCDEFEQAFRAGNGPRIGTRTALDVP